MTDQILAIDGVSEAKRKKSQLDLYALMTALRENIPVEKISILEGKPITDAICKNFERIREEKREWNIQDRTKKAYEVAPNIFSKAVVDKIR